ncbi:MAG TPA: hypothetical protein VNJ04_12120 [Gemmatimonadaceae bacterium]|nr:hypothetical protein [Gemmatimonadaceae bacterium]
MRFTRLKYLAVLLVVGLGASGCAAKARHVGVQGSVGLHASIAAIDDTEWTLYRAGAITAADHAKLNPKILALLRAGKQANAAVKAWPPGTPAPAELMSTVMQLGVVAESIADALPDGPAKTRLQERIAAAKAAAAVLVTLAPLVNGGT